MNKDLFLYVYKNKFINIIINNEIRNIHNKLHKYSSRFNCEQLKKSAIVLSQYGYIDQIKSLEQKNQYSFKIFKYCSENAARFSHLDILKYIVNKIIYSKFIPNWFSMEHIFAKSLRGGNVQIIEYIFSLIAPNFNMYKITSQYISYAVESGRIEVCEWFANHLKEYITDSSTVAIGLFENATKYGNLDLVKWGSKFFINYKADINSFIWVNAIRSKNIALLDFMYNQEQFKIPFRVKENLIKAFRFSNIGVTEWLLSKDDGDEVGTLDHKQVFESLMGNGDVEMIEYFSEKFGYKIGNPYKNKAEWFYKMCESSIGAYRNIPTSIIIWWYENITNFQLSYNPLDYYDTFSLDLLRWFTENNRPEKIPPHILNKFRKDISLDYNDDNEDDLAIIDYIRYRTELFPNINHIMDLVLLNSESMELADLIMMKYKQVTCSQTTMMIVVSENKLESVKWIHNNTTIRCTDEDIESAYFLKDSAMIEWLHQNVAESCDPLNIKSEFKQCPKSVQSFIIHNKPEMIPTNVLKYVHDFTNGKFIIDNYPTFICKTKSMIDACASGNVEIVKYLHEYYKKHGIEPKTNHFGTDPFKKSLKMAIKKGFTDIFIYLFENGPDISKPPGAKKHRNPMNIACKYGRLNICKYLQEHTPFKLEPKYFDGAVESGNLELVQWIYENHQYQCSNKAFESAGKNHHFQVVRYLLDTQQYKITEDIFTNAIISSNLEFVKFCIAYGYKYKFNIMRFAAKWGAYNIEQYFHDIGFKNEQTKKRKLTK